MSDLIIHGGKPLSGTITPSGNKNTVLPILCATLLTDAPVTAGASDSEARRDGGEHRRHRGGRNRGGQGGGGEGGEHRRHRGGRNRGGQGGGRGGRGRSGGGGGRSGGYRSEGSSQGGV